MAVLKTVGIASILPFVNVISSPEIIHTNKLLSYLYGFSISTPKIIFSCSSGDVLCSFLSPAISFQHLQQEYCCVLSICIIDLVLIGNIDQENLNDLVRKTERYIDRKIRTLILRSNEWEKMQPNLSKRPLLRIWNNQKA
jgi:hypothetical protein